MKRKYLLPLLLLVQILLVRVLGFFPEIVEAYYSKGLYPMISSFSRSVFGKIPFSFGDVLYGILIFFCVRWFWKNRKGFFKNWKNNGLTIISFMSVLYFLFHVLWGLNYYRIPLHEKLCINKEYTLTELESLTEKMILETNALQLLISKNDTVAVFIPYTQNEIFNTSLQGYHRLPTDLKEFDYHTKSIKKSLISLPLSFMGFGGYMNPFTNEAQVNALKPKYTLPITTCHEMAHQTGIGSESECNFIGYMAAKNNNDVYFQYSAKSFVLRYCLLILERIEEGKSEKYFIKINKGILKNFDENEQFWNQYETPINSFFEVFYDSFLKANQQKDGMDGYSKFIGLLIGYEK